MSALASRDREQCYRYVQVTLEANDYHNRRKDIKTRLRNRIMRITGFSRAQVTRLIRQHRQTGRIVDRRRAFG